MKKTHFLAALFLTAVLLSSCGGQPTEAVSSQFSSPAAPVVERSATLLPTVTSQPQSERISAVDTPEQAGGEALVLPTVTAPAQSTPGEMPASVQWQLVAEGFTRPLGLVDDGTGGLLVVEQAGVIRAVQNGVLQEAPFLDIHERVGSSGSEQGLLGLTLEPDFANTGRMYVNYTDLNGDTVISRFNVMAGDPTRADPASEVVILQVDQPYANHNGGYLTFGPDGYLYLGLGDGGSAGDPQGNAQNPNTLLGKLLRIDVVGQETYAVPADNPFVNGGGLPEIYSLGLRNPWRFSFDRQTGDLWIADVGQNAYEEINWMPAGSAAGANFGWDFYEASHPFEGQPPAGAQNIMPVWEYGRDLGCSITGGYVYRGESIPGLQGAYIYADYCNPDTWALMPGADGGWQARKMGTPPARVSAFGEDAAGEIYLLDHSGGAVFRMITPQ